MGKNPAPADSVKGVALAQWTHGPSNSGPLWVTAALVQRPSEDVEAALWTGILTRDAHGFHLLASDRSERVDTSPMLWNASLTMDLVPYRISDQETAFGVRFAASVQLVLSGALVAVLVFVLAAAAPHADAARLAPLLPHGWAGVGLAMSLYIWAFAGWEAVAGIGGEFRNPRRDIPRATALALVIVSVAYLAIQTVTVLVLGDRAAASAVPLLDLVEVATGSGGGVVVAVIAAIVVTGVFNAYLAAFSKLGAAMGRDGDLPSWFGRGAENGAVARRGLLLSAVVMALYSLVVLTSGDLQPFILVHTSIAAAVYGLGVASAIVLLPRWSAGWWMALLSCVFATGLLLLAGWHLVFPAVLAVVAVLVGAFGAFSRRGRRDTA